MPNIVPADDDPSNDDELHLKKKKKRQMRRRLLVNLEKMTWSRVYFLSKEKRNYDYK